MPDIIKDALNSRHFSEVLARELGDAVNHGRIDGEHLAKCVVLGEHRTLQQDIGRGIVLPLIQQWAHAYRDGFYDGRNEALCKLCADIEAQFGDQFGLPRI